MKIDDSNKMITCRICGQQCRRIYGKHLMRHNISSDEYRSLYPGAPIMTLSDRENTTRNGGKHMKEEKYRKMFSDKIIGEKNPNYRNNTTEEQRKSRSPFSKSFVKYINIENVDEHIYNFIKGIAKNRISNTNIQYYLNKGYGIEDSKDMLVDRQRTFTLNKCIDRYGYDLGYKRWLNRQEKWLSSYKKVNYSKISQEMFISIYNKLVDLGFNDKVYFAKLDKDGNIHNTSNNYEYRLKLNNSYILPDFFVPSLSLIIEFDGNYYHRSNPENKERERIRDENIINSGYTVLHIKENEYNNNKDSTILWLVDHILKMRNE